MIPDAAIVAALGRTVETTDFPLLGEPERGKVRDSYRRGRQRILVATDRISAFDCVLGTIPFKGQVLNQMAAFWFARTADIVPNHVVAVPDPNVMVVHECDQLPVEFVVRGYITGVTKTSAWHHYERGVRDFCGNSLPDGLRKDQKLEKPILTPTTKLEKHDRPISRAEAIAEGLVDAATFDAAAEICFRLYARGVEHAAAHGLILVDTKYEIGRLNGRLVVTDEVHTPDSSRYWFADGYEDRFAAGQDQAKLDKEYVREWLAERGFLGDGTPPPLPDAVRVEAARRYIRAYETLSGEALRVSGEPPLQRMARALSPWMSRRR
jgi:phosphoribosylaminoimidazole-succinocarboxamide synthase